MLIPYVCVCKRLSARIVGGTSQTQSERREENADARMKRQLVGRKVAITKGKLDLGPWEPIFYREFDGRLPK